MNTTQLVIIGIVLVLLIVVLLVVLGKKRGEAKKVSFDKTQQQKELTREQKSGKYQAQGGFNFAPAGSAQPEPAQAAPAQPQAAPAQPEPAPAESAAIQPQEAPVAKPNEASAVQLPETSVVEPAAGVPAGDEGESAGTAAEQPSATEIANAQLAEVRAEQEETPIFEEVAEDHGDQATADAVEDISEQGHREAVESAVAASAQADAIEQALEEAEPAATESEPQGAEAESSAAQPEPAITEAAPAAAEPGQAVAEPNQEAAEPAAVEAQTREVEQIAPAGGRIGRLRGRLSRSQNAIGQGLMGILSAGDLDEDAWEEIEDTLIMADLGSKATAKVTQALREKIAHNGVASEEEARAMLREVLIEAGHPEMDRAIKAIPHEGKPAVIMVVGVNGTGKTTTTGKLARVLVSMGHRVLLGAADTFRAAAADQLETWGRRVGAETVRGKEGADPASVAFDAVAAGVEQGVDVVLVDTAGRLHTSVDLMDQLGKVKRVVQKKSQVDEVLLVIDATVGQNGLMQARVFREVVDITGVVLTKLDGTAKGGIVFQVQEELGVPVKLVGLGEGADDLAPFEIEGFVDALLGEKR
ncbi:signal recognition particle-docking protein FtsY [Corynebacterium lizhenjunii]|uniref:signal recognition particle-docking protein FtsY n=1 Tax=Corynebacterium lizhenjunii TaxID=2709394 RepID=UPI0013ECA3F6|nr:signal recognition particle-docking protein FtsY [Corynebacterium lizhenjunii]